MRRCTDSVRDAIHRTVSKKRVAELASRLIRERSDLSGDMEYGAGQLLMRIAAEMGLEAEEQPVEGRRSNILIRMRGAPGGKTLLYSGHIDVVPPGAEELWHSPPFEPQIRGDRLYGRGASDMKGSIAAMLHALEVLRQCAVPLCGEVLLALDVDEETSNKGMRRLLESGVRADACIVGEPTDLEINLGHKGVMGLWLTFSGRRAHASRPEMGVNPIVHAAEMVEKIRAFQSGTLDKRQSRLLGHSTMTVTMLQAGRELNSIPERCDMRVDRRYLPGETADQILSETQRLIDEVSAVEEGCRCTLQMTTNCPPGEIDAEHPLVKAMMSAVSPGEPERAALKPFLASCEMAMLMEGLGIPALIFGPGSIRQAHITNEYVELDQLARGAEIFARMVVEYLGTVQEDHHG